MVDIEDIEDMLSSDFEIEKKQEFDVKEESNHLTSTNYEKNVLNKNKDYKLLLKTNNAINIQIKNIENIGLLPKKNNQIRIVTLRSFDVLSILKFIIDKENIEECYLAVYSMGKKSSLFFEQLLKNYPNCNFTFLISSIRNTNKVQRDLFIKDIAKKYKNFRLIYAWSHAKIISIKTDHNYYVVEGSGNFNHNARIEQYLIENNKQVYDFHKKWINDIKKIYKDNDLEIIDF